MMNSTKSCTVNGCASKSVNKRGWCSKHYARWRNHGSPTGGGTEKGALLRWIKEHINHQGDCCLIWPFERIGSGYASINYEGRTQTASRIMCLFAHGEPPSSNYEAAHSCGRGHKGCVNPKHLSWKTISANQMDRVKHRTSNRGEAHGLAKLTESDVVQIRLLSKTLSRKQIAEKFNVHEMTVGRIVRRDSWSWLE